MCLEPDMIVYTYFRSQHFGFKINKFVYPENERFYSKNKINCSYDENIAIFWDFPGPRKNTSKNFLGALTRAEKLTNQKREI